MCVVTVIRHKVVVKFDCADPREALGQLSVSIEWIILNSVPFPYRAACMLRTLAGVKFSLPSRGDPGVLAPLGQLLDSALGHTSSPSPPAGYCQPGLKAPGLGSVQGGFTAQPTPILEKQLRPVEL